MRQAAGLLHRWVGLFIAGFLIVTGLTGAVISWDHELDEWLNPHLTEARVPGPALPPLELARAVEARDPRVRATFVPLSVEPGESLAIFVQPAVDPATGRLYEPGYNQVFLDPATGEELGRREWGQAWPISRETLVSFLYKLHFSLHMPEVWGIDRWGIWLLGGIAILWTIDCFIGFYLTLPPRPAPRRDRPAAVTRQLSRGTWARWKPAWMIKRSGSSYRITFDIHRAVSLWTWALLLTLAFTGFSLNLYREVFLPLMSQVSQLSPTPFMERAPAPLHAPIAPRITREEAVALGQAEASRRGWAEPAGSLFYAPGFGLYGLRFFQPGDEHGAAGVGPPLLYLDGQDGRILGRQEPWVGTAADIFVQAQFPLHSGRILGLPGRILISVMGVVVAVVSATGVLIWWRKQSARSRVARRRAAMVPAPGE
ncbi:PepSY-associated TM helix domain-containing protein [Roseicella frigidaeris]|uniref:PepSY domain-containing protein n=1 Tax=Roseicella frigidaeris TaxID=2230885 RepID=A0A327M4W3_9PROT|nr:PepSY-associated TM helix domain-containing protein [Roseicella frigidaeris]RAI57435.1 PepSY domain-containing protein [Roseicella frigidaeris]